MMNLKSIFIFFLFVCLIKGNTFAQPVPALDENIPALVTFGKDGDTAWGDDDFIQVIFFSIPETFQDPIFIRVYDPDVGGYLDEQKGEWNTRTNFAVYGGQGACSDEDARRIRRDGNFRSGTMLASRTFGNDGRWDGRWFTFGPFNPSEGELLPEYGGNIFKLVVEGLEGDDGNLYRLFLSTSPNENRPIEGAFAFYFKYKFRLHDDAREVSHIYPYIDDRVVAIKQSNFDWDDDGIIRIISPSKNGELMAVSGDDEWATSTHQITEDDINSSLDIQMIKDPNRNMRNNNVVIYLENQYGELMPFYSIPIGGIPRYKYSIGIKPKAPAR
ncbi:hypothetical protein [Natronoflexus pectinivorans]|uniref:Uncharacterized protein n=1 Tax=Natronoflexus pectinivorans TaxID=682526 RepID=A0A4R2GNC9_9BACT|nr:hypothetical protein [Natronoflexus pectinivorans]TCO10580.1 hypothetical protein EV194_101210 [Natronoflexus pectinivorans]